MIESIRFYGTYKDIKKGKAQEAVKDTLFKYYIKGE